MAVKKSFKQTEVGIFPIDWDVLTLGHLSEFMTSGSRGWAKYYSSTGSLFIRSQNVRDGQLDLSESQFVFPPTGSEGSRTCVKHFDLLITMTGNSVGNVAFVNRSLGTAYVSQHVGLVRLKEPQLVEFISRFLAPGSSGNFQIGASQTGQSKPGLNLRNLSEFVVVLPPRHEQIAIAEALSDADALIESLEQLLVKKRQIKQAAMQDLLTGKKRLPGFTGKWETYRFDQLFTNLRNASSSRSELALHGEVAYVHYGDIHIHPTAFLNPVALQTFIARAKVRAFPRLMDGDLLMADASEDTMAIGKAVEISGLNGAEAIAGLHTMALRGNKEFLADGFKGFIQYMPKVRNALVSLATGVSVYGITKSGVKAIEVTIPRPDEQTAISGILTDMDKEITLFETKLSKAQKVKQGMMQELLTGRIRLV